MRSLVSGILGNLWIRSIVDLMLWTRGRLLRGGVFRVCNIRLSFFITDFMGCPLSSEEDIDEQQKFSDIDLIS
jgi:hypothetical protein